jgi:hypothetical protein
LNFRQFRNQQKIARSGSDKSHSGADEKERLTMSNPMQRETATIYEFPAGGRTSRNARSSSKPAAHPPPPKLVKAEYGRGWYHDAAVEEEQSAKTVGPVPLFTDRV